MGILAIKEDLLKKLRPVKFGGGTVNEINKDHSFVLKTDISVFEPGHLISLVFLCLIKH